MARLFRRQRTVASLSLPVWALVTCTVLVTGALGCSQPEPVFYDDRVPKQLSEWAMLVKRDGELVPNRGVVAFDLNTALFSDYAHKLRTVWMPEGLAAKYDATDTFDFPVGTVITKTFFYPVDPIDASETTMLRTAAPAGGTRSIDLATHRLIETRLLVHRETGWIALPYVWNDDETEAEFKMVGEPKRLALNDPGADLADAEPFTYLVPDTNQCAGCHATNHTTGEIKPIGPKARHLNRTFAYGAASDSPGDMTNQLTHWQATGRLTGAPGESDTTTPSNFLWLGDDETLAQTKNDPTALDALARSYLDVNCSHCHNPNGPADTSGLHLDPDTTAGFQLGLCKPPVAAGRGTQDRLYAIFPGRADLSIMPARLNSLEPDIAMPELGRGSIHHQGVDLLVAWINSLSGDC